MVHDLPSHLKTLLIITIQLQQAIQQVALANISDATHGYDSDFFFLQSVDFVDAFFATDENVSTCLRLGDNAD